MAKRLIWEISDYTLNAMSVADRLGEKVRFMMFTKVLFLLAMSVLVLALALGCSDDNDDSPAGPGNGDNNGDTLTADGVFAVLTVCRGALRFYYPPDLDTMMMFDVLSARFDSSVAPCTPYTPLQATGVKCNLYDLPWVASYSQYQYPQSADTEFVQEGGTYVFTVTGSSTVPSMVDTIVFPDHSPCITSPLLGAVVYRSGFDVLWADGGSGEVYLSLISPDDSTDLAPGDTLGVNGVFVVTANDGSYSFSSSQLTSLASGEYLLILNHFNKEFISRPGYDSRSFIVGKVTSCSLVSLQ